MGKRRRSTKQVNPAPPVETRAAESLTVFWMLTLLSTIAAEVIGLIVALVAKFAAESEPWTIFAKLLLLIALVTSSICLLVTPVVLKLRQVPPPPAITWFAIAVSSLPVIAALWTWIKW